jgi:predicted ArsR family transcriptional regulator
VDVRSDSVVHSSWLDVLTDPVRLGILRTLSQKGVARTADLMSSTHTSERTLRRHLDALVAVGVVRELRGESDGQTPGRPASRFALEARIQERAEALFTLLEGPLVP